MSFTTALSPVPTTQVASASAPFKFVPLDKTWNPPTNASSSSEESSYIDSIVSPDWSLQVGIFSSAGSSSVVSAITIDFPTVTTDTKWNLYAVYFPYLTQKLEESGVKSNGNGSCFDILGGPNINTTCLMQVSLAASSAIKDHTNGGPDWSVVPFPEACLSIYGNKSASDLQLFTVDKPVLKMPFLYKSEPSSTGNVSAVQIDASKRIWPVFLFQEPSTDLAPGSHFGGLSNLICLQVTNATVSTTTSTGTSVGTGSPTAATSAKSSASILSGRASWFLPISLVFGGMNLFI